MELTLLSMYITFFNKMKCLMAIAHDATPISDQDFSSLFDWEAAQVNDGGDDYDDWACDMFPLSRFMNSIWLHFTSSALPSNSSPYPQNESNQFPHPQYILLLRWCTGTRYEIQFDHLRPKWRVPFFKPLLSKRKKTGKKEDHCTFLLEMTKWE